MRHPLILTLATLVATHLVASGAMAEEIIVDSEPADETLVVSPSPSEDTLVLSVEAVEEPALQYQDYRLQELERTARRSRNALIGTSIAAAVGFALVAPAASGQCQSVDINGESEYECTRAGDALLRVGSPLLIGGLTGAVVSGIILGVRKGKIRRLNDSFTPKPRRAVRWDSTRLVF